RRVVSKTLAAESGTYQLIDFGDGEKLESFAGRLIRRPSPAAQHDRRRLPAIWKNADSLFHQRGRRWEHRSEWPKDLRIDCGGFFMPVQPTPFGHVGLFPEQAENWQWLRQRGSEVDSPTGPGSPNALNLFGYSGASSIAMASVGIAVAHVDAAKANVSVCRAAAGLNGLADHPIRYLVDDAAKFAAREVRRGNRYQTIILDPPAYGHSPTGKTWRLERDLWPLLENCLRLLDPKEHRVLVTGHSPQVGPAEVIDYLREQTPGILGMSARRLEACCDSGRLVLVDDHARRLDAGFYVRFDGRSG
ncbi:MAG: class I SAM-dependent methyltransferase, partial [Planctomycetota bacterium]